jgi:hypothetical protein
LLFKSSRPTYAIILVALSSLWMCAMFLPLLYSVVFPNNDLRGIVYALEERGAAPAKAADIVKETLATAGPLRRAVQVGYYSGVTATVRISGSQASNRKQASYLAWFQKRSKPLLLVITRDEGGGSTAFYISEGKISGMVRSYSLPTLLFGVSLFLMRRRSPNNLLRD